jgi:phage gpG-like protein
MSGRIEKFNMEPLHKFVKEINSKKRVRVGIFGDKNGRQKGADTNASLGAIHEFGSISGGIPARSFLRMPIHMKAKEIIKNASDGMGALLKEGGMATILKTLGFACESVVQMAFASRGFGKWKPNSPVTIRRKGSSAPLIDTGQLRRAISSKVV